MAKAPCIIVHGGIENFSKNSLIVEKMASCRNSARLGYEKLFNGGNAIDAIEVALRWLEDDELFNCGYGSVLNQIGEVQMDAILMTGNPINCGSVLSISTVDHPISLAKQVLKCLPNSILLEKLAEKLVENTNELVAVSNDDMTLPLASHVTLAPTFEDFEVNVFDAGNYTVLAIFNKIFSARLDGTRLLSLEFQRI